MPPVDQKNRGDPIFSVRLFGKRSVELGYLAGEKKQFSCCCGAGRGGFSRLKAP